MKFSFLETARIFFRHRPSAGRRPDIWQRLVTLAGIFLWLYFALLLAAGTAVFIWYAWLPLKEAVEPPVILPVNRSAYARALTRLDERTHAREAAAGLKVADPFSPASSNGPSMVQ
ncbi:hypothetical protein HYW67_03895 [Candidatus Parcubacteria bacterium]|nr:hypothetical protein [Candidatus Parcubacteria bacterium]